MYINKNPWLTLGLSLLRSRLPALSSLSFDLQSKGFEALYAEQRDNRLSTISTRMVEDSVKISNETKKLNRELQRNSRNHPCLNSLSQTVCALVDKFMYGGPTHVCYRPKSYIYQHVCYRPKYYIYSYKTLTHLCKIIPPA